MGRESGTCFGGVGLEGGIVLIGLDLRWGLGFGGLGVWGGEGWRCCFVLRGRSPPSRCTKIDCIDEDFNDWAQLRHFIRVLRNLFISASFYVSSVL